MIFGKFNFDITFFVKSTFYFFKLVGLSPMNFGSKSTNSFKIQDVSFTYSKWGILYNVLLTFIVVILNYFFTITPVLEHKYGKRLKFDIAIDTAVHVSAVITSVLTLILFCVHQQKAVSIGNKLKYLIIVSSNLHNDQCWQKTTFSWIVRTACLAILITWICLFVTLQSINFTSLLYFSSMHLCNLIITFIFMQYSLALQLMQQLMKTANENFIIVSKEAAHFTKFHVICRNKDFCSEHQIDKFSHLCEFYYSLYETSEDISDFYSRPILLCITKNFVSLLLFAYYIAEPLILKKYFMENIHMTHMFFVWLHYAVPLVVMTKSVSAVVTEVKSDERFR